MPNYSRPGATSEALTAEKILHAIGCQMLDGIERLHKRAFAPSRYEIRLHGSDFDHLNGIFGAIEEDARSLLDEQLERLNRGSFPDWIPFTKKRLTYAAAEGDWFIRFIEDPDDDLGPGQLRIVSELASPPKSAPGGGTKTVLVSTRDRDGATRSARVETRVGQDDTPVLATLTYCDDGGMQRYAMRKEMIVIGRANEEMWTDVRLATRPDVSRQHVRIRYDRDSRRFYLLDTSSYGTTIDGEAVPTRVNQTSGDEDEPWVPLPDVASIGLAGVIELDFAYNPSTTSEDR